MKRLRLRHLSVLLLVGMLMVIFLQRSAISRARAHNEALRHQQEAAASSMSESADGAKLDMTGEIDALRLANQELPKIRNEVRTLRDEKLSVDALRAEVERLAAALQAKPASPPR